MRKGNTLRWTEHADNCLQDLEKSPECSSDIFLVQLVKLRMITEKAYDAPWSRTGDKNPSLRPPAAYYLNALENQVHQFKSNIPSDLVDNSKFYRGVQLYSSMYIRGTDLTQCFRNDTLGVVFIGNHYL